MTLNPDFWANERKRLVAILSPFVAVVAGIAAAAAAKRIGIPTAENNEQLDEWRREYTDALAEQLNNTSQGKVNDALTVWADTPDATREDLRAQLSPVLADNEARAEAIGTTESTRVFSEGDTAAYRIAEIGRVAFGPPAHVECRCFTSPQRYRGGWVIIWETDRDEIVCRQPIDAPWGTVNGCRELQNTIISEGEYLGQKI